VYFFSEKAYVTKEIFQGFLFERTRIDLVPPGKTRENKKASEFNHEMLRGLSMQDP
jgi:hypothetical protein